jgi:hypothetical protein
MANGKGQMSKLEELTRVWTFVLTLLPFAI